MQVEFKLPEIYWTQISGLKTNERNPRKITDDKFGKLKANIERFPKMMGVRPVVINSDGVIQGGNMRFRACSELGWEKIPVIMFDESWTEEEMKMFIIVDNSGFGMWDYEIMGADYSNADLDSYAIDINYDINQDGTQANDVDKEWEDMPEMNAEKIEGACQSIHIHFETPEDVQLFAEMTGLKLTEKTKASWFPYKENFDNKGHVIEQE